MGARVGAWRWGLVLALGLSTAACQRRDARPMSPLPQDFDVLVLGGGHLHVADLKGRPWVINLWRPR